MHYLDVTNLSSGALYCLIEALHEDVDDGVPGAEAQLQLCQAMARERKLEGYLESEDRGQNISPCALLAWELIPFSFKLDGFDH